MTRVSDELSAAAEEKMKLAEATSSLEQVKDDLRINQVELKDANDRVRQKESECTRLRDDNKHICDDNAHLRDEIEYIKLEYGEKENECGCLRDENECIKSELSSVQEQLTRVLDELSAAGEEKMELANTVRELERVQDDIRTNQVELTDVKECLFQKESECANLKDELHIAKMELKKEKECFRQKETECAHLRDECANLRADNDRIKKEYSEAIQLFDSEVNKVMAHDLMALQQSLKDKDASHQHELGRLKFQITDVTESNDTKDRLLNELGTENLKLNEDVEALNSKFQRQVTELEESNHQLNEFGAEMLQLHDDVGALNHKLKASEDGYTACTEKITSLQMDLQHAKAERDDKSLQLASINTKLDELFLENQELKSDIESLVLSKEDYFENEKKALRGRLLLLEEDNQKLKDEIGEVVESKEVGEDMFEKEMNAATDSAHNRFESMETQLNDKIARLVKDKAKLVSKFNAELIEQEEKYVNVKIELSAWKLEMQNILNRNEMLKKEKFDVEVERDQLKADADVTVGINFGKIDRYL